MAENEVKLMKGNEVIAHVAIRYGCDGDWIPHHSAVGGDGNPHGTQNRGRPRAWSFCRPSRRSFLIGAHGGASTERYDLAPAPGISLMSEG